MKSFGTCVFWGSIDQFVYACTNPLKKKHIVHWNNTNTRLEGEKGAYRKHVQAHEMQNRWRSPCLPRCLSSLHHRASRPSLCLTIAFTACLGYSSVCLIALQHSRKEMPAVYPMICQQMEILIIY